MKTYKVQAKVEALVEYTIEVHSKKDAESEVFAMLEIGDLSSECEVIEVTKFDVGKIEIHEEE